jgi:hypothetical protein
MIIHARSREEVFILRAVLTSVSHSKYKKKPVTQMSGENCF